VINKQLIEALRDPHIGTPLGLKAANLIEHLLGCTEAANKIQMDLNNKFGHLVNVKPGKTYSTCHIIDALEQLLKEREEKADQALAEYEKLKGEM